MTMQIERRMVLRALSGIVPIGVLAVLSPVRDASAETERRRGKRRGETNRRRHKRRGETTTTRPPDNQLSGLCEQCDPLQQCQVGYVCFKGATWENSKCVFGQCASCFCGDYFYHCAPDGLDYVPSGTGFDCVDGVPVCSTPQPEWKTYAPIDHCTGEAIPLPA